MRAKAIVIVLCLLATANASGIFAQSGGASRGRPIPIPTSKPGVQPPLERVSETTFRLGAVLVDTMRKEVVVPGWINQAVTLEFVASTPLGMKAYESALRLDTDAVSFNTALLLIGMDPSRSRVPVRHFDPIPPAGDRLELTIEWSDGKTTHRVPIEELLYDQETGKPIPNTPWVYTGSGFLPNGRYRADIEGALIGFVHSPSPIIENVGTAGVNRWGAIILNPTLRLEPRAPITLTIRSADANAPR